MNKVAKNIAKGLAITGLATGIVSGTLATGTGMLIGYYAQKDIDALATEYSQTQEFADLSNAEAERLEERLQFLEEAKQDYSEGALSSEQIAEFEDEYKTEVEYFQQDFIYDCLANTEDAYFQEKLEKCMKPKNVAKGFFYTGIAAIPV